MLRMRYKGSKAGYDKISAILSMTSISSKSKNLNEDMLVKNPMVCQLRHGVSRLMGPKKQGFCSKINCK